MRVQRIEIDGTAKDWAEKWDLVAPGEFTALQVEIWAHGCLLQVPQGVRGDVAYRLADRLLQKGKALGLWSFADGRWRQAEKALVKDGGE